MDDGVPAPDPASPEIQMKLQNRSSSPTVTETSELSNTVLSDSQDSSDGTATKQPAAVESPIVTPRQPLTEATSQDSADTSLAENDISDEFETSKACPRCPASFRAGEEPSYTFPVRKREKHSASRTGPVKCNVCEPFCCATVSSLASALIDRKVDDKHGSTVQKLPVSTPPPPPTEPLNTEEREMAPGRSASASSPKS